jgi:hypothetical protein
MVEAGSPDGSYQSVPHTTAPALSHVHQFPCFFYGVLAVRVLIVHAGKQGIFPPPPTRGRGPASTSIRELRLDWEFLGSVKCVILG